jgi:WS/DGAT/MGAT family acyltransferase
MGGVDAMMIISETPRCYMHTFKVAILDPSTDPNGWDFAHWRKDFESRLHLVPFFRLKLASAPLGINHPMWVDDPDFNLDYHVRRVACPAPGDHKALCEFMSSVYAYQLDRSRPLWMAWVVEGLQDGKVAIVSLVHHAYVDGVGAAWCLQQLYRPEPGWKPERVPEWQPGPWPSWGRRLWWAVRDLPGVLAKNLPRVVTGVRKKIALERRFEAEGKNVPSAAKMQKTPINATLSPGRTFVCQDMPLDDFKAVSKGLGATINDVFLACCAGTIRRFFLSRHYDADRHPLISGTPFAGRRPDDMPGLGNFATMDYCWLPTDVADPLERLRAASRAATDMKEHMKACAEAGADINSVMQICPAWLMQGLRWYQEKKNGEFSLFANVVLSNVPGPQEPIYLDRYRLDSWFSTGQIFNGTCLNMTMWSYCGRANLCILVDKQVLDDGWMLYDAFVEELQTLVALVPQDQTGPRVREATS